MPAARCLLPGACRAGLPIRVGRPCGHSTSRANAIRAAKVRRPWRRQGKYRCISGNFRFTGAACICASASRACAASWFDPAAGRSARGSCSAACASSIFRPGCPLPRPAVGCQRGYLMVHRETGAAALAGRYNSAVRNEVRAVSAQVSEQTPDLPYPARVCRRPSRLSVAPIASIGTLQSQLHRYLYNLRKALPSGSARLHGAVAATQSVQITTVWCYPENATGTIPRDISSL